jgi:exodeoxyribonuclease VII large subunit
VSVNGNNTSTPEQPWSLQRLSENLGAYIERLGAVWVEAEITQWGGSGGHIYGRMKDIDNDVTVDITIWRSQRDRIPDGIGHGDRVLARVKPSWYLKGGKLSMNVLEMRHAGIGQLLEQLEKLRQALQKEGLFDLDRKKPLPFLPHLIGLITGKDSDAEKDVLTNARLRWPDVHFEVVHSAVQGDRAVSELIHALDTLEKVDGVDVIIIARGGGDFQHLLPFSDEALLRRVAALNIPVVSAIGHEADRPLLDDISDLRASTPTDAAKRVVPDVIEEKRLVTDLRRRLHDRIGGIIDGEWDRLKLFRERPVLHFPETTVDAHAEDLLRLIQRGVDITDMLVERGASEVDRLRASVRALSPQGVLDRGYAIARMATGAVISDVENVSVGDEVSVVVARGTLHTTVTRTDKPA